MSLDDGPCERKRGGRKGAHLPTLGAFVVEDLEGPCRVGGIEGGIDFEVDASVGVTVVVPLVRGMYSEFFFIAAVAGLVFVG